LMRAHHPGAGFRTSFLSPVAPVGVESSAARRALSSRHGAAPRTPQSRIETASGAGRRRPVTAGRFRNLRALVTPAGDEKTNRAALRQRNRRRPPPPSPPALVAPPTEGADRTAASNPALDAVAPLRLVSAIMCPRNQSAALGRELQIGYRRLEMRRGARWTLCRWLSGEQFALPVAVGIAARPAQAPAPCQRERIVIAAADPLNLVGIVVPGERIPAISARASPSARPLEAEDAPPSLALTRRRRDPKCRLAKSFNQDAPPFRALRRVGIHHDVPPA